MFLPHPGGAAPVPGDALTHISTAEGVKKPSPAVPLSGLEQRLVLRLPDSVARGQAIQLFRLTAQSVAPVVDFVAVQEQGGMTLTVTGACLDGTSYVLVSGNQISPPLVLTPGTCPLKEPVALVLEPAGEVRGRLTVPVGAIPPPAGRIWVERCAAQPTDSRREAVGMFPAQTSDGFLRAWLPTGCHYLTVHFPGFTPVTFPGQEITPGQPNDLGSITLLPGAAVLARVTAHDTGLALAGATVEVFPAADFLKVAEATFGDRLRPLPYKGTTDDAGWVRLSGLGSGSYRLRIRAQDQEVAPLFYGPFELEGGKETLLPDVAALRVATVTLAIDTDSATEILESCQLALQASLNPGCGWLGHAVVQQPMPSEEGTLVNNLPPGLWDFRVICRREDGVRFVVAREEMEIAPGAEVFLALTPEVIVVPGRVIRGDEPVAAELEFFQDFEGGEGLIPEATADEEGEFMVGVRQPGRYRVRVREGDEVARFLDQPVELTAAQEIVVRLPSGSLQGRILAPGGVSPRGTFVSARRLVDERAEPSADGDMALREARDDGTFELSGLPAGRWHLQAMAQTGAALQFSEPQLIDLGPDETQSGLTLQLGGASAVYGRVLSPAGSPVVSASVSVIVQPAQVGLESMEYSLQTNADGSFTQVIPPGEYASVVFRVEAPGYGLLTAAGSVNVDNQLVLE